MIRVQIPCGAFFSAKNVSFRCCSQAWIPRRYRAASHSILRLFAPRTKTFFIEKPEQVRRKMRGIFFCWILRNTLLLARSDTSALPRAFRQYSFLVRVASYTKFLWKLVAPRTKTFFIEKQEQVRRKIRGIFSAKNVWFRCCNNLLNNNVKYVRVLRQDPTRQKGLVFFCINPILQ